jgi:catalase
VISEGLVEALEQGPHAAGERLDHARGIVATGSFRATAEAAELTVADHMQGEVCSVQLRFSNFGADPHMLDNDPRANPRGAAIRFSLPDGAVTDLVGHSANGFPARTPEEMLDFIRAVNLANERPEVLRQVLDRNPAAKRFVGLRQRPPRSYLSLPYYFLHALVLTGPTCRNTVGRLQLQPVGDSAYLDEEQAGGMPGDYLQRELGSRIERHQARMDLVLQVAEPGDPTDDITSTWPENRPLVKLGSVTLDGLEANPRHLAELAFNPQLLIPGIAAAGDPMLAHRCEIYRMAARRRWDQAPRST